MIEMNGISKTYRIRQREAGLGNAVKHLFSRQYTEIPALQDMSFTIPDGQIIGYIGCCSGAEVAAGGNMSKHILRLNFI